MTIVKTKKVVVCDKCGKILEPIKNLNELIGMPYEWYNDKNILYKYDIYQCVECRIIFRIRKVLSYYSRIVLDIIGWFIDKIKWVIWEKW